MRQRVIILFVGLLTAPCPALTLNELADIFEKMESAVEDVTIQYEWYNQKERTEQDVNNVGFFVPVSRAVCTFTTAKPFTKLQAYSETVDLSQGPGRTFTSDSRYTYNGTLFRQLSSGGLDLPDSSNDRELCDCPPEGFITKRTDLLRAWNSTPMAFTVFRFYPEGLLSQGLRERPDLFRIVDGIQQIRDFRTIELDSVIDAETGTVHTRTFLSIDHGYAPVRFEHLAVCGNTVCDGTVKIAVDVLALQEVADGLWFPFKGTLDLPGDDDDSTFDVKSVTLNQHLTKDDFNLTFPPGTVVNDETAWWPQIDLASLSPCYAIATLLALVALGVLYQAARRRPTA